MNTTPKTPHVHADIIKAWADGAMIQYRRSMAEVWTDLTTAAPIWHILFEYRIKPSNGFKHDECMDAFFKGAEIQYRKDETAEWMDTKDPNWHEVFEYRVKPTTCAQVYPASNLMPEELATLAYPNRQIKVPLLREVANAAIARAIDDGQVVRVDDDANKAFDKRLDLAEAALLDAGYERIDVEGNWRKSDVVDAEFDPDFQEVKEQKEPDELARMACRALCEYLGKSRDDVSFEVIQAIILLERNKP